MSDTDTPKPVAPEPDWEVVADAVRRFPVPGGWLYVVNPYHDAMMTFVPDTTLYHAARKLAHVAAGALKGRLDGAPLDEDSAADAANDLAYAESVIEWLNKGAL